VVDRSRSREGGGGTGLGLAIAKHLVEAHGGSLVAESQYGHGATFTMRVPAASVEA
jgi:two-component system phosphate regulon sensor histidine kinase PhoR